MEFGEQTKPRGDGAVSLPKDGYFNQTHLTISVIRPKKEAAKGSPFKELIYDEITEELVNHRPKHLVQVAHSRSV